VTAPGNQNEAQASGFPAAEPREGPKIIFLQNKPNSPIKSNVFLQFSPPQTLEWPTLVTLSRLFAPGFPRR
jgi:hypothetical protein